MSAVAGPHTVMEPSYFGPSWVMPATEYDHHLGYAPDMAMEEQFVKAEPNHVARPVHSAFQALSINSTTAAPAPAPQRPLSPPPSSKKIDMRLAEPGSDESKPGYLTPMAQYTSTTFWYFWHADMFSSSLAHSPLMNRRQSKDIRKSKSRPFDNEGRAIHPVPINPNLPFCQFVFSVLHSTQVSFSVTILALIYTHKYKKCLALGRRPPFHREVSEAQGFITGLMLANKYLDDNTYTNTTWAQFLGIPVKDVNDYELEWLDALHFNLRVGIREFDSWRSMLDTHIRYQRAGALSGYVFPAAGGRAQSASPPLVLQHGAAANQTPLKRTAKDAFSADVLHNTSMYEAARVSARKASMSGQQFPVTSLPTPVPSLPSVSPTDPTYPTLARSSSLSRQIARLPAPGSQRSSAGQEQMAPEIADLRQAALANNTWGAHQQVAEPIDFGQDERWRLAPSQPRLYFLQAAATPQFGPDPRYHKAIPHYLEAGHESGFEFNPYAMASVMAAASVGADSMDLDPSQVDLASPMDPLYSAQQQQSAMQAAQQQGYRGMSMPIAPVPTHFVNPQPGQFANAGPPGYAYGSFAWPAPPSVSWRHQHWRPGHAQRWSSGSDDAYLAMQPPPMCHTAAASQWSTPAVHPAVYPAYRTQF
ncbi:uncharacterized protein CcaverHIS019_0600890 [Cutaneotrichosporon cavernicola]|uniref:Cyclin N-terminal domain-containing protein n=1 Tax=Cutaneotrichosporon cavernicola TaxID=279322 RepID=A0AA48QXS0_9TREE|nr:uncharacterized protein CcaverHIS019_0600890 [Cutaneotrichosporon cavernicola]BEI93630.1 hypothetical protein CcaverHIS019_0600890 [Cutaneotrichosporon cavernicola]BEJ01407.1 hypothetical protein CcaverHIS631_0600890 [Cutaneotrichosporon cavernicola]